jgi:uncharacterized protein
MNDKFVYLNQQKHIYLPEYNVIINTELKDHFLKHAGDKKKVKVVEKRTDEEAIRHTLRDLGQIIFQTTQNCSLRCKYCVYGGTYKYQRPLTEKSLDIKTAKRGLDYILSIIKERNKKDLVFSFYGGEPLLNFGVIKELVEYIEKRVVHRKPTFFMTTNLTVCSDEIIEFLIDHQFNISVSLDGPRENHDAKRVFPDGRGSFDVIMNNLARIKEKNREYYDKRVGFEAVYSQDLDLRRLYEFFTQNSLVNRQRLQYSFVGEYDTCYYNKYPFDEARAQADYREVMNLIKDKMKNKKELFPIERGLSSGLGKIKQNLSIRSYATTANTCLFDSRLFIDADGRFHVCEKMNDRFPFGDVWQGLDFGRMSRLLEEFCALVRRECDDCEFKFLCFRCFVPFAKDGVFELDPNFCRDMKESLKEGLEKYIQNEMEGVI